MTDDAARPEEEPGGLRRAASALVALAAIGVLAGLYLLALDLAETPAPTRAGPIALSSAAEASARADELVSLTLDSLYLAFQETEEDAIYDALARAAEGPALEALYLQRRAALEDRGLEGAEQAIHELEVLEATAVQNAGGLAADARWRVLGVVGHDRHRHMRGNAYAARLDYARRDGVWRLVGFDLTAVDRTDAGLIVETPHEDGAADE